MLARPLASPGERERIVHLLFFILVKVEGYLSVDLFLGAHCLVLHTVGGILPHDKTAESTTREQRIPRLEAVIVEDLLNAHALVAFHVREQISLTLALLVTDVLNTSPQELQLFLLNDWEDDVDNFLVLSQLLFNLFLQVLRDARTKHVDFDYAAVVLECIGQGSPLKWILHVILELAMQH